MTNPHRVNDQSRVDLIFHLKWKSDIARHTDGYQASRVNIWRDLLPPMLLDELIGSETGDRLEVNLETATGLGAVKDRQLIDITSDRFDRTYREGITTEPRLGRFYPKGMLKGFPDIFKANVQPFRCVGLNNGHIKVDFNHPLAGREPKLSVMVGSVRRKESERGGASNDWLEMLLQGPGMQARWQNRRTDYFSGNGFERQDEFDDSNFYLEPRFVHHIDDTARELVRNTYGRFLSSGMDVLDLMSSWESHLPDGLKPNRAVGLGLNADELKRNRQLTDYVLRDLNASPSLPFESDSFDIVLNTVSVEYLTDPVSVFREVYRVLRPNGHFVVTFSNRWFPTKAIRLWGELHEFERMGLVLEYFKRSGGFRNLQTYSFRGLPRPHGDAYYPQLPFSDPFYAVWGRK
jgi:SAM-dependent methyltransferase/FKBP-type peptidyl-prolyl cis-trans isomerase 2